MDYFSGQGKLLIAPRLASGLPGAFRWLGDVSDCEPGFESDSQDYKENWSGNRNSALTIDRGTTGTLAAKLLQFDKDQFNFMFRGASHTQTAGSVTNIDLGQSGDTLSVGNIFSLGAVNVSGVTIEDSAGTPKVLTAGTHFTLNAKAGSIEIIDLTGGPYTMPLKADYTKAAAESSKLFAGASADYWVRFEGVNTAVGGNPAVLVEFYKVRALPAKALPLINADRAEVDIEFSLLIDQSKTAAGEFGQYGRYYNLG